MIKLHLPCATQACLWALDMLSTLYWECFKGYILALRDKNVAFILYTGECWGRSGQVCRKPDLLALLTPGGEFQHASPCLLTCQGRVLKTYCRRVFCFPRLAGPTSRAGDAGHWGCCAHLQILKQLTENGRTPFPVRATKWSKVLDLHKRENIFV